MSKLNTNTEARKETFRRSQQKKRERLTKAGKVALSTYVSEETMRKIEQVRDEHGLATKGDAVDWLLTDTK